MYAKTKSATINNGIMYSFLDRVEIMNRFKKEGEEYERRDE